MKKCAIMLLASTLLLANNLYAEEGNYTCQVSSIYLTGKGRSVDPAGEILSFSIKGEILTLTNTSDGKTSNYDLNIQTHNNFAVLAKNESMIFSYRFNGGAFEWSTGIGKSDFNRDLGHTGKQMRVAGACAAN